MTEYNSDWNEYPSGERRSPEDDSEARRKQEQERRRRRNIRRKKRERELRRKKRMAAAAIGIGAAGVVALVLLLTGRTKGAEDALGSSQTIVQEETAETSEVETADSTAMDAAGETESGNEGTAPYVFHETENTVQLGKSLTDISIYDAQRHIVSTASSSGTSQDTASSETDSSTENSETAGTSSMTDTEKEEAAKAPDYVDSQYAILVNTDTGEILAERNAFDRIVPASMTKVMTLLVAVEQMQNPEENLKDKVTITQEICDESYRSGSSFVGYGVDDEATVEDLLYGAILPSGADAAMALAEYTSGSQEAFAELMNQKAKELGISDTTHFTNCVGLYDEDHYSTVYDMSVIMRAAIDNELCRKVLSQHTWTTQATKANPDGIQISNWFLRRIEDHDTNGTVVCGKTGFVNESGNCAVSYQEGNSGTGYIACTALTYNQWRSIYDHIALYKTYTK